MNLIQPDFLKKGDTVAIIATARKISRLEVQQAIDLLHTWGLNVITGKHLFGEYNQFAGTDEERAMDLQTMLNDVNVKAIIVARGGYGTVRIIDKVDFTSFKMHPKWIVGYSDVTVLHSHIHALGIQTAHATMPINFAKNEEATDGVRKILFGEKLNYDVAPFELNRTGKAQGQLVGGNLSLLYALQGSNSDIDTTGKILFIEDLDEYLYHIDRMMMALKRSGKLEGLAGLIVGGMSDMKDNTIPFGKNAEEIIIDAVKEYNYPVCFHFPAGHIDRNMALKLGAMCTLQVTDTTVYFEQSEGDK
jgi:muramoyltetrapeptide carboxypeptidase